MSTSSFVPTAATRDVDVRGFSYALEPVRQRQQWRLDKSMASLAQAQHALLETETRMAEVLQTHDEQSRRAGEALLQRMNPHAHRQALGFLAQLRERWQQLDAQRRVQLQDKARLRAQCVAQQLRLDGLDQHKEDALTEYAHEVRQRNNNEQDRDWLARGAAHAARSGDTPE